jgi:RecB family endonuclease NucS
VTFRSASVEGAERRTATSAIGKIQRVPLREVWRHEAHDFTAWLRDNIDVLNDALNLSLSNAEREQAAGDFSVDLVAEDESENPVVIENQLEKSNHDHLGKLLTYLVAIGARTAIWIVADPRPEHVSAIA